MLVSGEGRLLEALFTLLFLLGKRIPSSIDCSVFTFLLLGTDGETPAPKYCSASSRPAQWLIVHSKRKLCLAALHPKYLHPGKGDSDWGDFYWRLALCSGGA